MKILLILSIALQIACAPTAFYKRGMTQESFANDKLRCRQYGMQRVATMGLQGNGFNEWSIQIGEAECFEMLGYQRVKLDYSETKLSTAKRAR